MKKLFLLGFLMFLASCSGKTAEINSPNTTNLSGTTKTETTSVSQKMDEQQKNCETKQKTKNLLEIAHDNYSFTTSSGICMYLEVAKTASESKGNTLPAFALYTNDSNFGGENFNESGDFLTIFSDPLNPHSPLAHEFSIEIFGADFINTLDNAFLYNKIEIPKEYAQASENNPLRQVLEFRGKSDYKAKKREFWESDKKILESRKQALEEMKKYNENFSTENADLSERDMKTSQEMNEKRYNFEKNAIERAEKFFEQFQ